jgi:DNA-binding NarL/FixJ family response regulator
MSARPGCPGYVRQDERMLTARQLEILAAAAVGESVGETARRLFISMETVKGHRKNVRRLLAAGTTARAVYVARELGLLA